MSSTRNNHIIKKQRLKVRMTDREQAEQMQERISDLCHARLAPLLEKLCDELDPGDTVLRIDKLSIDVGSMAEDELDELLEHRLEKHLRDEIQAQLYEQSLHQTIQEVGGILFPEDGLNKGFSAPKNISESAVLEHFLTTGTLPWWKSDLDRKTTATLFKEIFERNTQMLIETVIRITTNVEVSRRILNTVPNEHLVELHTILQPEFTSLLQKFEKDVKQLQSVEAVKEAVPETYKLNWPSQETWIKDAHAFGIVAQYPEEQFPIALLKYWVKSVAMKVGKKPVELVVILNEVVAQQPTRFEDEIVDALPKITAQLLVSSTVGAETKAQKPKAGRTAEIQEKFKNNPLVEFIQPKKPAMEEDVAESPFDERVFEERVESEVAERKPIAANEYEEGDYEMSETLSSIKQLNAEREAEEQVQQKSDAVEGTINNIEQKQPESEPEVVDEAVSAVKKEVANADDVVSVDKKVDSTKQIPLEGADSLSSEVVSQSSREVEPQEVTSTQQDVEENEPPITKAEQMFKNNPLVEFVRPSQSNIASQEDDANDTEPKETTPSEEVKHLADSSSEIEAEAPETDSTSIAAKPKAVHDPNEEVGQLTDSTEGEKSSAESKASASEESASSKADAAPKPKQKAKPKPKLNAPTQGRAFSAQSPSSYIHPLRANWKGEESFYRWGDTPNVNEAYIHNCGLVLLWVYLPNFFKNLGYVEGKEFVSEEAQFKAVNILQKVVLGPDEEYEEFDLSLNKILCGLDVGAAVPTDIEFTEEELEHVENLCVAAVKNWAVLKNTPVSGFRQAFLQRKGKLEKDGNGYRIYVESSTPDVLISFLPWSIQIIKLPWVSNLIFTEWKTQF